MLITIISKVKLKTFILHHIFHVSHIHTLLFLRCHPIRRHHHLWPGLLSTPAFAFPTISPFLPAVPFFPQIFLVSPHPSKFYRKTISQIFFDKLRYLKLPKYALVTLFCMDSFLAYNRWPIIICKLQYCLQSGFNVHFLVTKRWGCFSLIKLIPAY